MPQGPAPSRRVRTRFGGRGPSAPPQRGQAPRQERRRRAGPPRSCSLPRRSAGRRAARRQTRSPVPQLGTENAQPPVPRASLDAPRGHEEPDSSRTGPHAALRRPQGPGSTTEMPAVPGSASPRAPAPRPSSPSPVRTRYGQNQYGQDQYGEDQYGQGGTHAAPQNDQFARPEPPQQERRLLRPPGRLRRTAWHRARPARPRPARSTAPRASTTARPGSTACRASRTRPPPASSSARRSTARTAGTTSAPRSRRPSSVRPTRARGRGHQRDRGAAAGDGWALPLPPAPVTDVRRCTTRWRPTGSTATARRGPAGRPGGGPGTAGTPAPDPGGPSAARHLLLAQLAERRPRPAGRARHTR